MRNTTETLGPATIKDNGIEHRLVFQYWLTFFPGCQFSASGSGAVRFRLPAEASLFPKELRVNASVSGIALLRIASQRSAILPELARLDTAGPLSREYLG